MGPDVLGKSLSRLELRSEEHTSELQSQSNLVCRLLLEKKNKVNLFKRCHGTFAPGSFYSSLRFMFGLWITHLDYPSAKCVNSHSPSTEPLSHSHSISLL